MNDNEIVKALECCSMSKVRYDNALKCSKCPAYYDERCTAKPKEVLDFVNRLQAENERLQNRFFCKVVIDEETVRKHIDEKVQEFELDIREIKSAAREEFAERLCEGRVSNDPVVIAVKVELEMMDGKEYGNEK